MKSKKYLISGFVISATIAFPLMTYANTSTLASLVSTVIGYLNMILDLIMGIAVVMFVWYVIQYFIRPGDVERRKEAGAYVMWAIIGFFVILSMWGIVNVLTNTFNLDNNAPPSWNSISNIFPSGGGSSGSNNVFNQGVPSYNSSPSQNYYSGYTSGGNSGSNYNPFGSGLSSGNRSSGSNGGTARTPSKSGAGTNSGSGTAKGVCSKYFNICISNSSGARGTILKDSDRDFDLLDQKDGIMIALIYSKELSFNGAGSSFTNVSLLGQKLSAYKRSANGVTQVITGTQTNGATLVVMLVSKNDITASRASTIIGSINLNK